MMRMLYFWFFLMPAFTEGYCGDGRTVCPGGGYGHSYDVQRGRSFAEGFSQGYSNQNNGGMGFVLVIVIVGLAYFGYKNKDRLGQFSGSRAAVERAVQDYNLRSDISDKASVTNSSVVGSFVAVRDLSGNLLAEVPLPSQEKVSFKVNASAASSWSLDEALNGFEAWLKNFSASIFAGSIYQFSRKDESIQDPNFSQLIEFLRSKNLDIGLADERQSVVRKSNAIIRDSDSRQIAYIYIID